MLKHDFDEIIDRSHTGSKKWDTYPKDVIPMWIADTDFKAPQPVIDALAKRVAHGVFGYASDDGSFERATKGWLQRRFGWDIDAEWAHFVPTVVTGIGAAIRALSSPGDKVVIQTPVYPPFTAIPTDNGRTPLASPLVWRDGAYAIDFADLEAKLADPRATLMLLCSPHNPSGRNFLREELARMGELCLKHGVRVISDEIHADFVYKGEHIPFPTLSPELAENCVVCINPSKTFNIADMRTAALITPGREIHAKIKKELLAAKIERSALCTLAYATAYTDCDYYADQAKEYLGKNLDYAARYFAEHIPGISTYRPESTFLLWLDCRELGLTQPELVTFFVEKAKVACNSGTDFGREEGKGFMRMNIGCPLSVVTQALERIERAVKELRR